MRLLASGFKVSCCLSIVIMSFAAASCGTKVGSKSRLSETTAGSSVNQSARVVGGRDLLSNPNIGLGHPHGDAMTEVLISRDQYVVSWNQEHRTPNWVAWRLRDSDMGSVRRTNAFAVDPDLEDYLVSQGSHAVTPQDFQGSCFDRGHMAPSADRTASVEENSVTFLMSNMMPQTAHLNRFTWEHFEEHERNLVRGTDQTIYIVAGGIFPDHPAHIGPAGDIAVPMQNFKVLLQASPSGRPTVLAAVLMANNTSTGTDPVEDHEQACADSRGGFVDNAAPTQQAEASFDWSKRPENTDWQNYRVSVDVIAKATGLDFSFVQ